MTIQHVFVEFRMSLLVCDGIVCRNITAMMALMLLGVTAMT